MTDAQIVKFIMKNCRLKGFAWESVVDWVIFDCDREIYINDMYTLFAKYLESNLPEWIFEKFIFEFMSPYSEPPDSYYYDMVDLLKITN
jgi:hypothetical protein